MVVDVLLEVLAVVTVVLDELELVVLVTAGHWQADWQRNAPPPLPPGWVALAGGALSSPGSMVPSPQRVSVVLVVEVVVSVVPVLLLVVAVVPVLLVVVLDAPGHWQSD